MKLQGIPASPGVVSGCARRLTEGPISVQLPVSAPVAGTPAEPPGLAPSPGQVLRKSRIPTPAAILDASDTESRDWAVAPNEYRLPEQANTIPELQGDLLRSPPRGLQAEDCSSSPSPQQPGLPSQTAPSEVQLPSACAGPPPDTTGSRTIVVASTMTARELLQSCQGGAVGVILERCDWNSDTMVLARSLGIPLVCGLGAAWGQITDRVPVILDGTRGIVTLPDASESSSGDEDFPEEITSQPDFPEPVAAVTRDGITIRILLTLEFLQQTDPQMLSASDGIGVWRRDRPHGFNWNAGSTGDFLARFRAVADQFQGHELQIALSLPRERPGAYWGQEQSCVPPERICDDLEFPIRPPREWLIAQVQALRELAKDHPVTILFSQIDSREDLENALATLGEMAGDIDRGEFPFGVGLLLESPSAALSAREWLPLVNGLTIDWDGLSQHLAGPENLPAEVDPLAGCLSPPVLKLLLSLTELARIHGTRLTLCGHLLGEPLWTAVALAIGVRRLSVTPWNFRSAQHTICQISDRGLGELRQLVSEGVPAREIQSWLQQHMHR